MTKASLTELTLLHEHIIPRTTSASTPTPSSPSQLNFPQTSSRNPGALLTLPSTVPKILLFHFAILAFAASTPKGAWIPQSVSSTTSASISNFPHAALCSGACAHARLRSDDVVYPDAAVNANNFALAVRNSWIAEALMLPMEENGWGAWGVVLVSQRVEMMLSEFRRKASSWT